MSKPGDKDWLPREIYLQRLARKRVSAGALFFNPEGKVLLIKRSYRPHWTIPGGNVEAYESPIVACEREVFEEIGIRKTPAVIAGVEYAPKKAENDDALHFIFNGGVLTDHDISRITLQSDEVDEYRFFTPDEIEGIVLEGSAPRWRKMIEAAKKGTTVYFSNEEGNNT